MAVKILLVEDDKSLREIYGVRLQAEGYEIVSASDGEQALAVAIKERPSLIITDVMMPKISGFDMLDILRSTTETKDIKVIMMTALSSDDQRTRGERMGADRYLVKSQVGIEDVVRTVHEVLGDSGAGATPAAAAPAPAGAPAQPPTPAAQPPSTPAVPTTDPAAPVPAGPPAVTTQPAAVPPSASAPVAAQVPPPAPATLPTSLTAPSAPSARQKIIQPVNDINDKVDINELLDKELAKEAGLDMLGRPQVASTDQEKAVIQNQLKAVAATPAAPAAEVTTSDQPLTPAPAAEPATPAATPETPVPAPTNPAPQAPAARPAAPTVPGRDTPLQAPPRIPTI